MLTQLKLNYGKNEAIQTCVTRIGAVLHGWDHNPRASQEDASINMFHILHYSIHDLLHLCLRIHYIDAMLQGSSIAREVPLHV
ncbi:hypothetical protein RAB80_014493 [Fusarium oxysporum f. sp. vasinfectum]|nr:hypothetical protein RAB80_014493 [Fusarium oxysporum f. sp. vasinfectum]